MFVVDTVTVGNVTLVTNAVRINSVRNKFSI